MSTLAILPAVPATDIATLANLTVAGCRSPHTRAAYTRHICRFLGTGRTIDRSGVLSYLQNELRASGAKSPTINQALSAIRKLADEARAHGIIDEVTCWGVKEIKDEPIRGTHMGQWLTKEQIKTLYAMPDRSTLQGKRDAALFALLIGCGLRREETVEIAWHHYQERDGRMLLVNITGKGNKIRTVPVPKAAREDLDAWYTAMTEYGFSGEDEIILRRLRKGSDDLSQPLAAVGVWHIVSTYAQDMELDFSPHDLRRSMARAMYKASADITQIQLVLGHAHIETTMKYINADLEIGEGDAATDTLELEDEDG